MALFLDTTVLIDALRGRPAADRLRRLAHAGPLPYTSAINVEEVFRGVRVSERAAAEQLVGALVLAPLGVAEAIRAGDWRRDFASRGTTLSQADCLIAAACVGVGATLATGSPRDFPMEGLHVEHWVVGG